MTKGFFITGTDTGVGKTVITAALIQAIRLLGLRVCGMKPIETGCKKEGDLLIPSDGLFIKEIANMKENIKEITPCCFENPLAPLTASRLGEAPVDLEKIFNAFRKLSKNNDAVIVEGIGGLLVPITRDYFVIDLARDFGLPILSVSRPGLGTLNHTMLTVNYAIKEGLVVVGIIINYSIPPEGTIAEKTNPEIIKQISPVPILGIFPYLDSMEENAIEKTAIKNLDIEIIRKYL
ncbi:MAG: dethiobiotin synthase [Nitrospirota bacterium]